jgi:hypothetical protein
MIANTDADTVRAKLHDRRGISVLDQVATALLGNAGGFHPFLKTHHPVLFAADPDQFAPLKVNTASGLKPGLASVKVMSVNLFMLLLICGQTYFLELPLRCRR